MASARAPKTLLVDDLTTIIGQIESVLQGDAIRAAIAATTQDERVLAALAHTLRRDPTILTGPAGARCVIDIEPLIRNLHQIGATHVVLPRCTRCANDVTALYSRQLKLRLCRACAQARYDATLCTCVQCGRHDKPTYRARGGGMLCRRCIPEPGVDHHAAVIDGLTALHTGLAPTILEELADSLTTTAARRELHWILHDHPDVFTGAAPHQSARSVRLALTLIAAGAHHIAVPRCPLCSRETTLAHSLDGHRCCKRCWHHRRSRGPCARCHTVRHLRRLRGTEERLCTSCFRDDESHQHPCSKCGVRCFVEHRDGDTILCSRCYRKPVAICATCGGRHQCWRGPDGHHICSTCAAKRRASEACSHCTQMRPVHMRSDTGAPLCGRCARRREPCARCAKTLPVSARLEGVGPLCSLCLKREPAYFTDCVACGAHGRAHHRGLCPACALPGVLQEHFQADGELGAAAEHIIGALLTCDPDKVLRWIAKTRRSALSTAIGSLGDTLTHEALDQLPPSKSLEWLRNLLVDAGALPHRDPYLHRTERYVRTQIDTVHHPDDRATLRSYARWHHLRKLRAQASKGLLRPGGGSSARREISTITLFLNNIHNRGATLQTCRQQHVDDWISQHPTKAPLHQFLAWSVQRGAATMVTAAPKPDHRPRHTLAGDDERWQLIQHTIETPGLDTRDRVAGLLILLYSQPTARLVRLKLSDVSTTDDGTGTRLLLGELPITLPEPLDRFVNELVSQRRGYAAVTATQNPWLFPGGRSGQHLSPQRMGHRLRSIGITPRLARNTAVIDLAGELPAAVIAKLLGFNIKRAAAWNIEAGNTNPKYAASLARMNARKSQAADTRHRPV